MALPRTTSQRYNDDVLFLNFLRLSQHVFPLFQIICDIPEHLVFVLLYTFPVYFMAGLNSDSLVQFLVIVSVIVYCSRSLAYFAAALLPAVQLSVLFAQMLFTLFLLSCGFIFNLDNLFIG